MTTWWRWGRRRAAASRVLVGTQLLLVIVTTAIIAGTLGWSEASATTAARTALVADGEEVSRIEVRMRQGDDPAAQDQMARDALRRGFHPAPVTIAHHLLDDPGGGTPFAVWEVLPDVDRIRPDHLDSLAAGAAEARRLVEEADVTGRGVTHDGDLAPVAEAASDSWRAARTLGFVPLSVLVLVTVLGVTQVAGLLAGARESEVHLMVARGASPRQLVSVEVAESVAVTAVGTVVGTAGALGLLSALSTAFDSPAAVLVGGAATGALIVATLAVTTGLQTRRTSSRSRPAHRVRAVAGISTLLLVLAAAALSLWQLGRAPTVQSDRLAAMAPALGLLAAAVVGLVVAGPLTRLAERVAHSGRGLVWPLAASQVSRRLAMQAVPVVLTVLATGTTVLAGYFSGTATDLDRDVAQLARGADVRAVPATPPASASGPTQLPTVTSVEGVSAAAPVWLHDGGIGDLAVGTVVTPLDDLADVVHLPRGLSLPVLDAPPHPDGTPAPVVLPEGTTRLTLDVSADVFLDAWQQGAFDLVHDLHEAWTRGPQYAGIPSDALEQLARDGAVDDWSQLARPVRVEPALVLRDLATGGADVVEAPTLVLEPRVDITTSPTPDATFSPATGSVTLTVDLPAGRRYSIDAVHLEVASQARTMAGSTRSLVLEATALADGVPVFGDATSAWTADHALPRALVADILAERDETVPRVELVEPDDGTGNAWIVDNRPPLPTSLDTSTRAWRLESSFLGYDPLPLRAAPGLAVRPEVDPDNLTAGTPPPHPDRVPVALTPAAAAAAALDVGDRFELRVLQWSVPVELAELVAAVPGMTTPHAALVDSRALGAWTATRSASLPRPHELWIAADDPAAAAAGVAEVTGIADVTALPPRDSTPVSSTALTFQVASAGAWLLALVGVVAAGWTQLTARRPEVATLRAIGVPARAQALGRAAESVLTLVPAAVMGVLAGWGVSHLVVAPLARSAVPRAEALGPVLRFDPSGPAVLLAAAAVALALAVALVATTVRSQAVDRTYREEVR